MGAEGDSCLDTWASVKHKGSPAASGTPRVTTAALAYLALVTPTEPRLLHDSMGPPSSVTLCILQLLS